MNEETEKTIHSSSSIRSHLASSTGNFTTKARNLGMRPEGAATDLATTD